MRVPAFFAAMVVFACAVATARPVGAQSLADVGKKEEERRDKVKQPSKTYTNKDLGAPPQVFGTPPTEPAKPADAAGTTPAPADPAQRAVIERDRQRAVVELDSLNKALKDDQKAITDFDEEARKASVPPGWLR